jgi:hypothetical protein
VLNEFVCLGAHAHPVRCAVGRGKLTAKTNGAPKRAV